MENYRSRSGKPSGVTGYEIGLDFIIVRFTSGDIYKYSERSCGNAVGEMAALAVDQLGLSTFIAQNRPPYEWKR